MTEGLSPLQKETPRQFLTRLKSDLKSYRQMRDYLEKNLVIDEKLPPEKRTRGTISDPEYCKVNFHYAQGEIMAITGNEQRSKGEIELPSVLEYLEALVDLYPGDEGE